MMSLIFKEKRVGSFDARSPLTDNPTDGMNANMKAKLLLKSKDVLSDGSILEMMLWLLPKPVLGCSHSYKYRLYFGRNGERLVGYDNERPKGDHRHLDGQELSYVFSDVDQLVVDFMEDVRLRRERDG